MGRGASGFVQRALSDLKGPLFFLSAPLFRDVPKAEVKKMLHSKCKQLNRLDQIPDRLAGR